MPNIIELTDGPEYYGHEVIESISATAGFGFANYSYFGLAAVLVYLFLLLLCDLVPLVVVEFTSRRFYIPLFAMFMAAALKFLQSDYFTVWLTHGFALVVNLALVLSWQSRPASNVGVLNQSIN